MIPNTSVSPAASRKSSSPNCRPLRHCSRKRSMDFRERTTDDRGQIGNRSFAFPTLSPLSSVVCTLDSPLHRALVVELVLAVLDNGGDGLEREVALRILDHVLQIEILYR